MVMGERPDVSYTPPPIIYPICQGSCMRLAGVAVSARINIKSMDKVTPRDMIRMGQGMRQV